MDGGGTAQDRARRLSGSDVIDAAIVLAETQGLESVTIRRIAQRLTCPPASVHQLVADRDELLCTMLEHGCAEVPVDADAADPAERLVTRFGQAHDHLAERLWIPQLLTRGDLVATSTFGFADACVADLLELGLAPAQAVFAFRTCWHLTLGELLVRHAPGLGRGPTQRERAVRSMDRTEFPHYAHVLDDLDPLDDKPPDRHRESLELLVAGIVATHGSVG